RVGDAACVVYHLAEREEADVGPAQERSRRAEARHVHHLEPGLLDEPGGEAIVRAGRQEGLGACRHLPQTSPAMPSRRQAPHGGTPFFARRFVPSISASSPDDPTAARPRPCPTAVVFRGLVNGWPLRISVPGPCVLSGESSGEREEDTTWPKARRPTGC